MPAYDYRCLACDEMFEITRPAGSDADVFCPSCGARSKRVFTPVGVVFKGSGFHNTDYRARPSATESATNAKSGSESGSEASPGCPAAKTGTCSSCPAAD